jgi:tetratricopeptide (TPR) repeat protein
MLRLFGTVTWWMFWNDGDHALDALDDERDGRLRGAELHGPAPVAGDRAAAHRRRGDFERAIADYDTVPSMTPDFALAWYERGLTCAAARLRAEAIGSLRTFLHLAADWSDEGGYEAWIARYHLRELGAEEK